MSAKADIASLSQASLSSLPKHIAAPGYDRAKVDVGIVHFGPGAFHRTHQASYLDHLLKHDPRWGIAAVSLKSPALRDALAAQDNLYTLATLGETPTFRIIGALKEVHYAPQSGREVLTRLADPRTRVVTVTVTEKGYGLTASGELDTDNADLQRDLSAPRSPVGLIGYLTEGLRRRHVQGWKPFTTISCDNLIDNGSRLKRAVVDFARERDPDLASWIEGETAFPRTMVDSITPETDDNLRRGVEAALGLKDAWPVQREAFSQWVIEQTEGPGPDWARVGVDVTTDVSAYESAKLRLLNGAHSSIAYLGSLAGYETVAEAMGDTALSGFIRELMIEEILPTLRSPRGLDLPAYAGSILQRFRNPSIRHNLAQIAWDGSQKLPIRILGTISDNLAAQRPIGRLAMALAAWMRFIRARVRMDRPIVDPLADKLAILAEKCRDNAEIDVPLFLGLETVFPRHLAERPLFVQTLGQAYTALSTEEFRAFRAGQTDASPVTANTRVGLRRP